jgi:hypothetical protein
LGLLLHHAEHSADLGDEKVHRGDCPDELVPAAEVLGQRRLGVDRTSLASWDASAVVRRDASADDCLELLRLDADAEKSVVLEQACPEPDDSTWDVSVDPAAARWLLAEPQLAWAELDKPVAVRSAAQSCVAQAAADEAAQLVPLAVELELARSATELVLVAQSSLAESAYARPEALPGQPKLSATSRPVQLGPTVGLALQE